MIGDIPYVKEMAFEYGVAADVSPNIRRLVAPNPSLFTFRGTNTYIVGRGRVAVVDPGPDLAAHREALALALEGETVSHILITHTHRDHSPGAAWLKARTGAPMLGFGPHGHLPSGQRVEEDGDGAFAPDVTLPDGDIIEGDGWILEAVHTPGHCSNHLCYALRDENALLSGDHVMGWSTSVIAPLDGDMRAYMASLEKLKARPERVFWPGHGPEIPDPGLFVEAFIAHRRMREREILAALAAGPRTIEEIVEAVYTDIPETLMRAAGRSVHAHLIHMVETGRARCDGPPEAHAAYRA